MKILSTARLRLEPLRVDHAAMVFDHLQSPDLYVYIPQDPPTADWLRARYETLARGKSADGRDHWLNWTAFPHNSATPVGTFQATVPENGEAGIAYMVFPAFQKKGFAREMARCVLSHIFDTYESPGVYAEIDIRNIASIRLVASLGFVRVATTKNADFFKGAPSDEFRYACDRVAWQSGSMA